LIKLLSPIFFEISQQKSRNIPAAAFTFYAKNAIVSA
jgi:hypothetical protein